MYAIQQSVERLTLPIVTNSTSAGVRTHFFLYRRAKYTIMISLMNMRTTLILMAATMAPIYAQEPAENSAQIYARLAAPTTVTTATVEQRAAAYPALSIIPADVESVLTVNRISEICMGVSAALEASAEREVPAELGMLDSFTIATGKGSAELYKHIAAIYAYNSDEAEQVHDFFTRWSKNAATPVGAVINKPILAYINAAKSAAISSIENLKLPSFYSVVTVKPEGEQMLGEWQQIAVSNMREDIGEEYDDGMREIYSNNGYEGIKITLKGDSFINPDVDYDYETDTITKKPLNDVQLAARKAIDGRTIYVGLKQEGTKLIAVVTENEADFALPTDAAASLLGTDKLCKADANLTKSPYMLCYATPGINFSSYEIQTAPFVGIPTLIKDIFTELAAQPGDNQTTWAGAAKGAELLSNVVKALIQPTATVPNIVQVWAEGSTLQLQYDGNTKGKTYLPGKLSLTSVPDKPGTIFYTESSPVSFNIGAGCGEIVDAIVSVVDGMIATVPAKDQAEIVPQVAMAKQFLPDVKELCAAIGNIGEGMGNSTALTIDSAGNMPMLLGGTPGNKTAIPRICFYAGVTDRSKLSSGWNSIVKIAGNIAGKLDQDPAIVNMLPIVPSQSGNLISYTVAMPWFTPDMVPCVAVSDTTFTAGTSSAYNAEIAAAATGNTAFTGSVCTLKFNQMASTARGIARELATVAKAEKEPLSLNNTPSTSGDLAANDDIEDGEDYIEEEDYEEEDLYTYHRQSPAEERAETAEDIAETLENAARFINRIDGVSTINGSTHTLRLQIQLSK